MSPNPHELEQRCHELEQRCHELEAKARSLDAINRLAASLLHFQADIDDSVLRSPRDGRVQYRVAQLGEVLAAGGRVLNLVDLGDVYMTFFLPTAAAGRVAVGTDVHLVLDAAPPIRHSGESLLRRRCRSIHAEDG